MDSSEGDKHIKFKPVHSPTGRLISHNSSKSRLATSPTTVQGAKGNCILAGAGFSYKDDDKVVCIDCGLELYKSTQLDKALQEHLRFKPNCPFITRTYTLGSTRPPKHPEYREYAARLDSFVSWPGRYVPQTPEKLATAGFYYIGSADRVTCFQCGVTLRDWEEEHDPATEHRECSPNCPFINEPDFHQLGVSPRLILTDLQTDSIGIAGVTRSLHHLNITLDSVGVPSDGQDADVGAVAGGHADDMENMIQDMGFSIDTIRNSRDMFRQRHGRPCRNVSELVDFMLDTEKAISSFEKEINQTPSFNITSDNQDSFQTRIISSDKSKIHESSSKLPPLVAENRRLRDKKTCKVCGQQDSCILFLPCGHLVTCASCADKVADCVVCHRSILGTVKTYLC